MGFLSGQVGFGRLSVGGSATGMLGQAELDLLAERVVKVGSIGPPSEIEAGWCAGEHVFDERFSYEKNVLDGGVLGWFGMRLDVNRVPTEIKQALKAQATAAALDMNGGDQLTRAAKREVKERFEHDLHEELASGKHRRSKLVEVLWDGPGSSLFTASSANTTVESLVRLWRETFGTELIPDGAGRVGYKAMLDLGIGGEFDTLMPTVFTPAPSGSSESGDGPEMLELPWTASSLDPKDFLGNELLIWLWHLCDTVGGEIPVRISGVPARVAVVLDKTIEMECAWGVTGKQSLRNEPEKPAPVRLPEAAAALAVGKWPRRVGMIVSDGEDQWSLSFQADRWLVSGCTLPKPSESGMGLAELATYRLERTRRLDEMLTALFGSFLTERANPEVWPKRRHAIREWIKSRSASTGGGSRPAVAVEARPSENDPTLAGPVPEQAEPALEQAEAGGSAEPVVAFGRVLTVRRGVGGPIGVVGVGEQLC